MKGTPVYEIQPAFTTGEISSFVASRVDLEKFKSALLTAENCIIRPYGGLYRRIGSKYIGRCKYNKTTILVRFDIGIDDAYLLEVGDHYIQPWHNGEKYGTEIQTPYEDPTELHFNQSAETMFICSGKYAVRLLKYDGENFTLSNFTLSHSYYDTASSQGEVYETKYITPGEFTYTAPVTGEYIVHIGGAGGGGGAGAQEGDVVAAGGAGGAGELVTQTINLTQGKTYNLTVGQGGEIGGDGAGSTFYGTTARAGSGGTAGTVTQDGSGKYIAKNGTNGSGYTDGGAGGSGGLGDREPTKGSDGFVNISFDGSNTISPSATTGQDVTLTSKLAIFRSGMEGGYIQLRQKMPSDVAEAELFETFQTIYTSSVWVGEGWKINTSGTWHGKVVLQKSDDNATWENFRTYNSYDDQNYIESGTFDEGCYMRAELTMWNDDPSTKSMLHVVLTRMPYTNEGTAIINSVISSTKAKVSVMEPFGNTSETEDYAFGPWNNLYGYPQCSAFFQDRLVFAGNKNKPYAVWMSRTGDYSNFGIEKASGSVTDDSAIMMNLISRRAFQVEHLIPSKDLIILTTGNEWVVSGDSVVKPSDINPLAQTQNGSSSCDPCIIGNRIIYIQRRNGTVRDMGYSYETDNYNGVNLSLLATQITTGHDFISSAYAQEPDSVLYLVRDDGILCCLTIIQEQNVYAWSRLTTEGKYKWICAIPEGKSDTLYTIVERNGSWFIEAFKAFSNEADTFLDSYITGSGNSIDTSYLSGTVHVLADGIDLGDFSSGVISFDTNYERIIAGKSYSTKIEQPGMEISLQDGTLQGRSAKVDTVKLRLDHSKGGRVGKTFETMDELIYPSTELYTGELHARVDMGQTIAKSTKVCIETSRPYPFNLSAIIREVSIYGGFTQ